MVKQASLASGLASIVGREHTAPGTADFAVDGLAPKSVVRPGTPEEVAGVITYANANALAVIPLGGRNHAGIGNLPDRYDLALDMTRLDRVVEFEPADLTITCQAGITLGELRQAAGEANMMVPFDPSLPDERDRRRRSRRRPLRPFAIVLRRAARLHDRDASRYR